MNFCPRTIVNGATMRLNSGKPVSIAVKVENYGGGSMVMQGIATDDARITINLRAPLDKNITNQWIEVIGTPTRPDAINASEVILRKIRRKKRGCTYLTSLYLTR